MFFAKLFQKLGSGVLFFAGIVITVNHFAEYVYPRTIWDFLLGIALIAIGAIGLWAQYSLYRLAHRHE
jgi:divalent metal cation (Fe/Co/Zn/Cd) transporter